MHQNLIAYNGLDCTFEETVEELITLPLLLLLLLLLLLTLELLLPGVGKLFAPPLFLSFADYIYSQYRIQEYSETNRMLLFLEKKYGCMLFCDSFNFSERISRVLCLISDPAGNKEQ